MPCHGVEEGIMRKSKTMTTNTGAAGEPAALTDKDLEAVSGGMDLKGASDAMTQRAQQNDPAQMFQQIMQQMTQGG
jgi:hypothetical protein